eukprot:54980_1
MNTYLKRELKIDNEYKNIIKIKTDIDYKQDIYNNDIDSVKRFDLKEFNQIISLNSQTGTGHALLIKPKQDKIENYLYFVLNSNNERHSMITHLDFVIHCINDNDEEKNVSDNIKVKEQEMKPNFGSGNDNNELKQQEELDYKYSDDEKEEKKEYNNKNLEENVFNYGEYVPYWGINHIIPNYTTLKDELTQNKIIQLSIKEYYDIYKEASLILTKICLLADHSGSQNKYFDIKYGESWTINHIICLLIYCNYSEIKSEFINYWIPNNEKEKKYW